MKKKIWKKNEKDGGQTAQSFPRDGVIEEAWRRNFLAGSSDDNAADSMSPGVSEATPQISPDRSLQGLEAGGLYSQFIDLHTKSIKMTFANKNDLEANQMYRIVANQTQITQKLIDFLETQEAEVLELLFPSHRDPARAIDLVSGYLDSSSTNFFTSLESEAIQGHHRQKQAIMTHNDTQTKPLVSEVVEDGDLEGPRDLENEMCMLMGIEKTLVGLPLSPVRKWSSGSFDGEPLFGLKEVTMDRNRPFFRENFFENGGERPSIGDAMEDS
jgi:hypothetical protein